MLKDHTLTASYLNGEMEIEVPKKRRKGNGKYLELLGATGHNLKSVNLKVPLGKLVCVTGVSGSGKSSLINQTLYPVLNAHIYRGVKKVKMRLSNMNLVENNMRNIEDFRKEYSLWLQKFGTTDVYKKILDL